MPPKCVLPVHSSSITQPLHTVHTGHVSATFSVSIDCARRADVAPRTPHGQYPPCLGYRFGHCAPTHLRRHMVLWLCLITECCAQNSSHCCAYKSNLSHNHSWQAQKALSAVPSYVIAPHRGCSPSCHDAKSLAASKALHLSVTSVRISTIHLTMGSTFLLCFCPVASCEA